MSLLFRRTIRTTATTTSSSSFPSCGLPQPCSQRRVLLLLLPPRRTVFCGQRKYILETATACTATPAMNPFLDSTHASAYANAHTSDPLQAACELAQRLALNDLLTCSARGHPPLDGGLCAEHLPLLQIGSGGGFWTQYLDSQGFSITGVEPSEAMITLAKRRTYAHATTFLQGTLDSISSSATTSQLSLQSFAGAAFVTSLEYMPDPQAALAQAARYVRPSGFLLLGVLNALADRNSFEALDRRLYGEGEGVRRFQPTELETLVREAFAQQQPQQQQQQQVQLNLFVCAFPETVQEVMAATPNVERVIQMERDRRKRGQHNGHLIVALARLPLP